MPGPADVQKYMDFHQKDTAEVKKINIPTFPKRWVYIGTAKELVYWSNKWGRDLTPYKHVLKKHGTILADPKGKMILIVGLSLNIKKEGLVG